METGNTSSTVTERQQLPPGFIEKSEAILNQTENDDTTEVLATFSDKLVELIDYLGNQGIKLHFKYIDPFEKCYQGLNPETELVYFQDNAFVIHLPRDYEEEDVAYKLALMLFKNLENYPVYRFTPGVTRLHTYWIIDSLYDIKAENYLHQTMGYPILTRYYDNLDDIIKALGTAKEPQTGVPIAWQCCAMFLLIHVLDPAYAQQKLKKIRKKDTRLARVCEEITGIVRTHGYLSTPQEMETAMKALEDYLDNDPVALEVLQSQGQ